MVILPFGDRGLLVEVGSLEEVLALHRRLVASAPPGIVDLVPAARTVLVVADPSLLAMSAARAWIQRARRDDVAVTAPDGPVVEVDVCYDGPDLSRSARLLGLSEEEVVRRHVAADWRVAFTGFAPGFAYLVSDDWKVDVPRLAAPRTRVPAGSVGLAAGFTGMYPRQTPGGWQLIGTTRAALFDPDAAQPVLLPPGTHVRFRRTSAAGSMIPPRVDRAVVPERTASGMRTLEPGPLTTVQDLGRPGRAAQGIARSGALDRAALRTANRLVGNPEDAACLEVTLGGLRVVAERDLWLAVTGAWGAVTLAEHIVDPYEAHEWPSGAELHLAGFAHGARAYLAVRGGVDIPSVAGSRASDRLAGLGQPALSAGDVLAVGTVPTSPIPVPQVVPWGAPHDDELEVELAPGPRADWFDPAARATLFEASWIVTGDSDRIGMRLDGPALTRVRGDELPSEGMVPGAVQVPPDGRPTILLADGPVTGGYPVIAVVADASLDLLAQVRPGTRIRFRHARPLH